MRPPITGHVVTLVLALLAFGAHADEAAFAYGKASAMWLGLAVAIEELGNTECGDGLSPPLVSTTAVAGKIRRATKSADRADLEGGITVILRNGRVEFAQFMADLRASLSTDEARAKGIGERQMCEFVVGYWQSRYVEAERAWQAAEARYNGR
jgi:hypothetical protein